jgi:hypothetical protein
VRGPTSAAGTAGDSDALSGLVVGAGTSADTTGVTAAATGSVDPGADAAAPVPLAALGTLFALGAAVFALAGGGGATDTGASGSAGGSAAAGAGTGERRRLARLPFARDVVDSTTATDAVTAGRADSVGGVTSGGDTRTPGRTAPVTDASRAPHDGHDSLPDGACAPHSAQS